MSGQERPEGMEIGTIFWAALAALFVVGALVALALLAGPKIKALVFPTPTPEPGASRVFRVRHDPNFECSEKSMNLGPPLLESYVLSALIDMRETGAWVQPEGESFEGWAVYWVYDVKQERLEYWLYGAGSAKGLVFELLPRCFFLSENNIPYVEFSEIEVRELPAAGEGNHG